MPLVQVVALYAANSIGAQLVPMYEAQLLKDWQYIIEDSGARLVLVGPETIYEKVKGFVGSVRCRRQPYVAGCVIMLCLVAAGWQRLRSLVVRCE